MRYKQTVVGIAWALMQPLLTMAVLTVLFGKLVALPSGGVPYVLVVAAAIIPWQLFSNALSQSSGSLVANANLISKVYFPRMIIPATSLVTSLVDFVVSLAILVALLAWHGVVPGWRIVALPLFIALALVAALGAGVWVTALNVKYRDFRYVVPFMLALGLYVSPVGFSSDIVPGDWRLPYSLNPMVGAIDGFRWALLGSPLYLPGLLASTAVATGLLIAGIGYFRKTERTFADLI